jgi:hypothetical protein
MLRYLWLIWVVARLVAGVVVVVLGPPVAAG